MRVTGYILASNSELIEESVQAEFINKFKPFFRADPGKELPIISQQTPDHLIQMRWGMDQRVKPGFFQYFTDSYGIIKKPFYRVLIRKSRCLIPANGILVRVKNKLYFLFSKRDKILTFAGIYHAWKEKDCIHTHVNRALFPPTIVRGMLQPSAYIFVVKTGSVTKSWEELVGGLGPGRGCGGGNLLQKVPSPASFPLLTVRRPRPRCRRAERPRRGPRRGRRR